jgi:hypothetical protein
MTALLSLVLFLSLTTEKYEWELRKNENNIKVYTSQQEGSKLLRYKAVATINKNYVDVYKQVVDFEENQSFLESVEYVKVINSVPDSIYDTYLYLDMPWPLYNRDLASRMTVQKNGNAYYLSSRSNNKLMKLKKDVVRINDFEESWKIVSTGNNSTSIEVIGWADPGGHIPPWVVNLFVVEEPYNFIMGLKSLLE